MKYEVLKVEVVKFDENYFLAFSGNFTCPPYDPADPTNCQNYSQNGVHCGDYQQGSRCGNFSYSSFTCYEYNGSSGSVNGTWYAENAPACSIF